MKQKILFFTFLSALFLICFSMTAVAQSVRFTDPTGDDKGPGNYTYPTDTVYTSGSFDIKELAVTQKGDQVEFALTVSARLEDPWRMGVGFAVQTAFVCIDADNKEGSGFTQGIPGTNVQFAPAAAWERCVILSPQSAARVKQEVDSKAGELASAIVIPKSTRGSGSKIVGTVPRASLPEGDLSTWGYQVIMQSNEGFPGDKEILTRRVNEFEGQHRFGGGNDADCDPHVMDILGDDQKEQLAFECGPDGSSKKMATLHMVRKQ